MTTIGGFLFKGPAFFFCCLFQNDVQVGDEAAQVVPAELGLFQLAVVRVDGKVVGRREVAVGEVGASESGAFQITIRKF